jgi:diguanylate cyclase (GGDEF)-like protein/PAS domain S-box-containing protein
LNLIAWPSFTLFPLHGLLFGYWVRTAPRSLANRLFAIINLQFCAWSLAHGLYVLAPDRPTAWVYYNLATAAWLTTPAFFFHFLLELTEAWTERTQRRRLLALCYLPACLFLLRYLVGGPFLDHDIALGAQGWYEKNDFTSPWALAYLFFVYGGALACIALVYRWQRLSIRRLERVQGRITVVFGGVAVAFGLLYSSVLPALLPRCEFSTMSPLPMAIWIFGIWRGVSRYGLLHITPAIAAENIFDTVSEPLLIADEEQRVIRVNAAFEGLLGVSAQDLLRRPLGYVLSCSSLAPAEWKHRLSNDDLHELEVPFQRADGKEFTLVVSGSKVEHARNGLSGFVVVMRDITALKDTEERLRHLVTHDPLTQLPNRTLVKDRVDQALARARRQQTKGALLLVDVDGFRELNEDRGYEAGDQVLRQVANRCRCTFRETDTIARYGGDEFVIVLGDLRYEHEARICLQRLERALAQPYQLSEGMLTLGVSIGSAIFPDEGTDLESLMRHADTAMHVIKQGAKLLESATIKHASLTVDTRNLESALPLALERKEFELWYQPLHAARTGEIVGTEALLRWRHPTYGTIGPLQFLPIAERSGLIVPIGAWVLRMACIQNKAWQTAGLAPVPVAVNVSVKQLVRPDFVETVQHVLEECELEPQLLQIEISEVAAVHDFETIKNALVALKQLGVRMIVDDFGLGYAALSQLSALNVHAIKISQFLIRSMVSEPRDATIVRAIVSMANAFGILAVAKGVETEAQLDFLRALQWDLQSVPTCELVQGFVFSRPVPATDVPGLLRRARMTG